MRPELSKDSETIVDALIKRGVGKKQSEIIEMALNLLFDRQMEEDSALIQEEASERGLDPAMELQADLVFVQEEEESA